MEQIVAGLSLETTMPDEMKLLRADSDYDVIRWMNENKGRSAAVVLNDTLDELQQMEERFKGSSVRPGIVRTVNSDMNDALKDLRNRTVPVITAMEDYTKIEYMGYENILFMPDFSTYSRKQIVDFIQMNHPCAVAIPADLAAAEFQTLLSGDIFVYAIDSSGPAQKAFLSAIGVDGFLETQDITEGSSL
jgi:hypothetical protein